MNLQKTPYPVDFVGNSPAFVVRAPEYTKNGRAYQRTFAISALKVGTLYLKTPYFTLRWKVRTTVTNKANSIKASTDVEEIYEQLYNRIVFNHTVNRHYYVSVAVGDSHCHIIFTDKTAGVPDTDIRLYRMTAISAVGSETTADDSITVVDTVEGVDPVRSEAYAVWAQFRVFKDSDESRTPELNFYPSSDKAAISTAMLQAYFTKKDLPGYGETFAPYGCSEMERRVQLLYADRTADGVGLVKLSKEITLLNGRLDDYAHGNNIPDWKESPNSGKFYQNGATCIFGQDNNLTVRTHADTEQFLYLYCGPDVDRLDETLTLTACVNRAGVIQNYNFYFQPSDNLVTRLPVSLSALGISNPATVDSYTVNITGDHGTAITRTFAVVPKPYNTHTLLLVNKMNLYESFTIANLMAERTTEGEHVRLGSIDRYIVSDAQTTFTARTGWKTSAEMQMLENAVSASDNILTEGHYGYIISIVPGTFTIVDEHEDLLSVEFQFVITGKINRAPATASAMTDPVDFIETRIDITEQ